VHYIFEVKTPDTESAFAVGSHRSTSRIATLAIVGSSLLWGTTGVAASFVDESVSAVAIGASTMVFGGLLLFATSARSSLAVMRDRSVRRWLILGVAGIAVYPLSFYLAMDEAGVAIGNVVALGSAPVFAAVLEKVVDRATLGLRWQISTGIAIVGIVALSLGKAPDEASDGSIPLGVALGLVAGASYALYTFSSARIIDSGHPGRSVMGSSFGLGALVLSPVVIILGGSIVDDPASISIAAYLALGPMFIAYLLFEFGLRSTRSSTATSITLIEPVVATVLAVTIVGERLEWWGWLGILLILGGVGVLVSARQSRNSTQPA